MYLMAQIKLQADSADDICSFLDESWGIFVCPADEIFPETESVIVDQPHECSKWPKTGISWVPGA